MVFSSSIRKAQLVKLCELCETETNLKWRCIQCNTILCEKCKTKKIIHNKVQTNSQHQIVDLKAPFQDVEPKVILDNIRCDEHQKKMTCLFCRTCDHLVCSDCVSFTHNNHNFVPIDKVQ
jgi:tripartite motif-containing protein 56